MLELIKKQMQIRIVKYKKNKSINEKRLEDEFGRKHYEDEIANKTEQRGKIAGH